MKRMTEEQIAKFYAGFKSSTSEETTEYVGLRVEIKNKNHPHYGETGTVVSKENTMCGIGWVVKSDVGGRFFIFNPDFDARFLSGKNGRR